MLSSTEQVLKNATETVLCNRDGLGLLKEFYKDKKFHKDCVKKTVLSNLCSNFNSNLKLLQSNIDLGMYTKKVNKKVEKGYWGCVSEPDTVQYLIAPFISNMFGANIIRSKSEAKDCDFAYDTLIKNDASGSKLVIEAKKVGYYAGDIPTLDAFISIMKDKNKLVCQSKKNFAYLRSALRKQIMSYAEVSSHITRHESIIIATNGVHYCFLLNFDAYFSDDFINELKDTLKDNIDGNYCQVGSNYGIPFLSVSMLDDRDVILEKMSYANAIMLDYLEYNDNWLNFKEYLYKNFEKDLMLNL